MFVYEKKVIHEEGAEALDTLNIMIDATTQIPANGATADVMVWAEGNTVYAQIGDNTISGERPSAAE